MEHEMDLTEDEQRLLKTYIVGPRIWDAAALLPLVTSLWEKGLISPIPDSPASAITEAGLAVLGKS